MRRNFFYLVCIALISITLLTFFYDVDKRIRHENELAFLHKNECSSKYFQNRCNESPADEIVATCEDLYKCMTEPAAEFTLYTKIAAGYMGEVLNDFFESISYDTLVKFFSILLILLTVVIPYAQWVRLRQKFDSRSTRL